MKINSPLFCIVKRTFSHSVLPVLIIVAAFVVFDGCAVWNFTKVRYQNVIGYFNTYYNAVDLFDDFLEEMRLQEESTDMLLEQTSPFILNVPPQSLQKLDKIIEKCSRILNYYPESKWIDNALLLIGKCYYYKQEFGRSERKFKELMESFPESNLTAEAQLWLGKTFFMMERDEDAVKMLERAIKTAVNEGEKEVAAEAHFALGDMALYLNEQSEAVQYFKSGVAFSSDDQRKARIQFLLARQEEKLGKKELARQSYARVFDFHPNDKLKFQAEMQYVRLSRELGDIDAAFMTLVRMIQTPRYLDYEAQIQLAIGHTLAASGDIKNALEQYRFVDTTYKAKPEASEAYYSAGKIYEDSVKDYDNAYDNYLKAKLEYPGSSFASKGGKRSDVLAEYRKLRNDMMNMDTLVFFVRHPDSLVMRDSLKKITDSLDLAEKIRLGYEPGDPTNDGGEPSSRRRLHGRNTGRVALQKTQPYDPTKPAGSQQTAMQTSPSANAPLYRSLKLGKLNADSLQKVLANLRFEMGTVMYLKLQNFDSARYYYRLALKDSIGDKSSAQVYFTLAQMDRQDGDSVTAEELEKFIIERYPFTPYAQKLMMDRNLPIPLDSNALALNTYNLAAQNLEEGKFKSGIDDMRKLIDRFPHSEQALRARLAIGMTYERNLTDKDNMLREYRLIAKNYPNSVYAKRPKEILQALDEMEKEKTESKNEKKEKPILKTETSKDTTRMEMGAPINLPPQTPPVMDSTQLKQKQIKKDPTQDPDFPLNPNVLPKRREVE